MAKFCPECPNRGNCEGEITGAFFLGSSTAGRIEGGSRGEPQRVTLEAYMGVPVGPTVQIVEYANVDGGRSKQFSVYGDSYEESRLNAATFDSEVDACQGPVTERNFPWIRETVTCGIVYRKK